MVLPKQNTTALPKQLPGSSSHHSRMSMLNVRHCWLLLLAVVLALLVLVTNVTQIQTTITSTAARLIQETAAAAYQQEPPPPELFIYIPSWMEGMSSWMISVSEIIVLSKELNATFVEPCIKNGRLMSCKSANDTEKGTMIRLGQVLDLALLKTYYNRIIPYEEFFEAIVTAPGDELSDPVPVPVPVPVVRICMHWLFKASKQGCGDKPSDFNATEIPQIDIALDSARKISTVLEITQYRNRAFRQSKWVDGLEAVKVKRDFIHFAPDNYRRANELLKSMGIQRGDPYSVIHWRAELPSIDYLQCADRVLQTRKVMQEGQGQQQQPFILMSSLNTNSNYMWGGAKRLAANTTSDQALQKLFDNGFLKLDQVVDYNQLADPGLLAVYDLILAMNAQEFATCSRQCTHHGFCGTCNWLGQFAGLAVSIRSDMANKSSHECWPR